MVTLEEARFPDQLDIVRTLFREYADSLGIDLGFQDFEAELTGLPGKFTAPAGRVLLAQNGGEYLGCVAMRPSDGTLCEMKRLYVRPAGRGLQAGRLLATRICRLARQQGYTGIRLDTLPGMHAALHVYRSLGFVPIPAYIFNPIEGAIYLELDLTTWASEPA